MKLPSLLSFAAIVAHAALLLATPAAFAQARETATHPFGASPPIPGRYLVIFKKSVENPAAVAANLMRGLGGQLHHTYGAAIKGFAATLPESALPGLRNNPNVEFVEQDRMVSLQQTSTQSQATWGLDRIDQADLPLNGQYSFPNAGAGVNAYIVDTGIRADHVEFTGRLKPGYTAIADGNGTNDCHGHGTHVSGTVGGTTWGVAKGVSLTPVRVLDCAGSGPWSGVVAGIDWVAANAARPAVANLSLGGDPSLSVDAAVAGLVAKGVTVVVAAGNNGADACNYSPAREPSAITVGATTNIDYRASYSNYGACVDIFAPGHAVTSAWNTSPTATNVVGGTSMASPHVAGAAALALANNPGATPADVAALLVSTATPNRLTLVASATPNLLLNSMGVTGAVAPAPQPSQTVAFKSMSGSAVRNGGNWKASALVTVRDVNTGAVVPNATVAGSFSPGGNSSCITGSSGSCTLTSATMKNATTGSTTLTGTGVSGALLKYDAAQNVVTQIVILRP